VTWLGDGSDEPSSITWCGIEFPLNVPVALDPREHRYLFAKALNNAYFRVSVPFEDDARGPVALPPEPLPEMPEAPPLVEQIKAVRRRVRGRFVKEQDDAGE
jgi:hypothetical protein